MDFLDQLRAYLQTVQQRGQSDPALKPVLTDAIVKRFFLEAISDRQRAHAASAPNAAHRSELMIRGCGVQMWHADWMGSAGRLYAAQSLIEQELRAGIGHSVSTSELEALARGVIRHLHEIDDSDEAGVAELELIRIASYCWQLVDVDEPLDPSEFQSYVRDTRLVRGQGTKAQVTPLGVVSLSLPLADAVKWLLCVESMDPGRFDLDKFISIDMLRFVIERLASDGVLSRVDYDDLPDRWHFDTQAFRRLLLLGILKSTVRYAGEYQFNPGYLDFVEELVEGRRTPMSLLAESLLAEERGLVGGHLPSVVPETRAGEIQAQHARMVLHEMRNALVPMRAALSHLSRMLERDPHPEGWQAPRDRIVSGIDRLFRFASDLEQVAELGAPPLGPLALEGVIRDAMASLNGGLAAQTRLTVAPDMPPVHGHRERLTMVFVNLLRNAQQNHPQAQPSLDLVVTYVAEQTALCVTLDDDGPGVPEAHREAVFTRGFSLRPGGSGQGLALVREVIEDQMQGKVHCDASPKGGARFTLLVPIARKVSP